MTTSTTHTAPALTPPTSSGCLQALAWTRAARRPCPSLPATSRPWSRYERLSFSMLGCTWGILILAVSALHLGNYDLDTRTSSTSGSHSAFHESARALKAETQASTLQEGIQP